MLRSFQAQKFLFLLRNGIEYLALKKYRKKGARVLGARRAGVRKIESKKECLEDRRLKCLEDRRQERVFGRYEAGAARD